MYEGIFWNSSARIEKNDFKDDNVKTDYITKGNVTEQGIFTFFINALSAPQCISKMSELTPERIMAKIPFTSKRKMGSMVVK